MPEKFDSVAGETTHTQVPRPFRMQSRLWQLRAGAFRLSLPRDGQAVPVKIRALCPALPHRDDFPVRIWFALNVSPKYFLQSLLVCHPLFYYFPKTTSFNHTGQCLEDKVGGDI